MMAVKNQKLKDIASFCTLLGGLGGFTFFTILQYKAVPSFLANPDSLNVIFILFFMTLAVTFSGILYFMQK